MQDIKEEPITLNHNVRVDRTELIGVKKDLTDFITAARKRIAVIDNMLEHGEFVQEADALRTAIRTIAQIITTQYNSQSRIREFAWARHAFSFLAREKGFALKDIAILIGKKDHSTIINSIERYKDLMFVKDKLFMEIAADVKTLFDLYYPITVQTTEPRFNN